MTYGEIRNKYKISRSSAQYIYENFRKPLKKTGRKELLTKGDKRRIISAVGISNEEKKKCSSLSLKLDLSLDVSRSTICRFLKLKKYNYKIRKIIFCQIFKIC